MRGRVFIFGVRQLMASGKQVQQTQSIQTSSHKGGSFGRWGEGGSQARVPDPSPKERQPHDLRSLSQDLAIARRRRGRGTVASCPLMLPGRPIGAASERKRDWMPLLCDRPHQRGTKHLRVCHTLYRVARRVPHSVRVRHCGLRALACVLYWRYEDGDFYP